MSEGPHPFLRLRQQFTRFSVIPLNLESLAWGCHGTPSVSDILQVVGALAAYAVDTCLMARKRALELPADLAFRLCIRFLAALPGARRVLSVLHLKASPYGSPTAASFQKRSEPSPRFA